MSGKFISISILFSVAILFSGCPMGIGYPAGYPGKEKIDKDLIGTWFNGEEDPEIKEVRITKIDDYSLRAEIIEAGSMYSLEAKEFTGWCTEIGKVKFVYWLPNSETENDYFLYGYRIDDKVLNTYDISLLDGGVDAVTSVESFRKQIETSIKMEGGLADTIRWERR